MGEQESRHNLEQDRQWVSTGMSIEEYIAQLEQRQAPPTHTTPHPRPYAEYRRQDDTPRKVSAERDRQEVIKPRNTRRFSKRATRVLIAAAVVTTATGAAYAGNVGNVQDVFAHGNVEDSPTHETAVNPLLTLGEKSLAPDQCEDPGAALMVVTVNGYLPLAPEVKSETNPVTTITQPPYMTEANKSALPASQQKEFEKFITEDGYPHATLNNLPLDVAVCEPTNAKAIITAPDGALTIDRSALQVSLEDPGSEFDLPMNAAVQVDGATDVSPDPGAGEYMTIPNPANEMFLSLTELAKTMQTPEQLQLLLATMETQAVQQIDNVVDGQEHITYPQARISTFQQAIDEALVHRLGGKVDKVTFMGNYPVQTDVPIDSKTKLPITSKGRLVGLDSSQKFHIESVTVANGAMKEPAYTPKPVPTPSPSESTSKK